MEDVQMPGKRPAPPKTQPQGTAKGSSAQHSAAAYAEKYREGMLQRLQEPTSHGRMKWKK